MSTSTLQRVLSRWPGFKITGSLSGTWACVSFSGREVRLFPTEQSARLQGDYYGELHSITPIPEIPDDREDAEWERKHG